MFSTAPIFYDKLVQITCKTVYSIIKLRLKFSNAASFHSVTVPVFCEKSVPQFRLVNHDKNCT